MCKTNSLRCPDNWIEMAAWQIRNKEKLETQSIILLPIVRVTNGDHVEYEKIADEIGIDRKDFHDGMHGRYIFTGDELVKINKWVNKDMYVIEENGVLKCPKCGSRNISIKAGFTTDFYVCMDCGNEMR